MALDPLSFLDGELAALREQGLYRALRVLDGEQTARAKFDHRSVVNLSSNNYLGLTTHPLLRQRAREAIQVFGVGSGSVRTIAGTMALHVQLEQGLARCKCTEAAVVFHRGFAATAGTVAALLGRDDTIVSDALNHASIIDGARLSRAAIKVFPHRDAAAAHTLVEGLPRTGRTLIISDGVFSMDGDVGVLPELADFAEEHGWFMMVVVAVGSGVFGENGRGTVDHFRLHGRVHVQVGTLSKAFGALGGYVAGSRSLIDCPRKSIWSPFGDHIGCRLSAKPAASSRGGPPLVGTTKSAPVAPAAPGTDHSGRPVQYATKRPSGENRGLCARCAEARSRGSPPTAPTV